VEDMSALATSSSSLLHFRNETNQMLTSSTNALDQAFVDDEVQRFDADSYCQKYGERWKRLATSVRDVLQNDGTIIREYVIEDPSLLDQLSDEESEEMHNEKRPGASELHHSNDLRTFTAYPTNNFAHQSPNDVQMRHESVHTTNSQTHLPPNQHPLMSLKNTNLTSSKDNIINRNSLEERQQQPQTQTQSTRPLLTTFESAKQGSRVPNEPVQANHSQYARYFQPIYSRNDPVSHELKPQTQPLPISHGAHYQPMNSNLKPNEYSSNQGVCQQMSKNVSNGIDGPIDVPNKHEDEIVDKEVEVIHEKGLICFIYIFY